MDAGVDDLRGPARRPLRLSAGRRTASRPTCRWSICRAGWTTPAAARSTSPSDRWGPLQGQMLHFSFGAGTYFLLLREQVDGQPQGAVVPLPGEFLSGVHRGRFNPKDGQLYVSGMARLGHLHRRRRLLPARPLHRRSGPAPGRLPRPRERRARHVHAGRSTATVAEQPTNHFAQAWNYRYSAATARPSSRRAIPAAGPRPAGDPLGSRPGRRPDAVPGDPRPSARQPAPPAPARRCRPRRCDLFATVHKLGAPVHAASRAIARRPRRSPPIRSWPTWPLAHEAGAEPLAEADPERPADHDRGGQEPDFRRPLVHGPRRRADQADVHQPRRRAAQLGPDQARDAREGRRPGEQDHRRARRGRPPLRPAGPTTSSSTPTSSRPQDQFIDLLPRPARARAAIPSSARSRATGWS